MKSNFKYFGYIVLTGIVLSFPTPSQGQDVYMPDSVIAGNFDCTNITACPGDTILIPLWAKNDENLIIMYFPIAIDSQYISADLGGNLYDILNPSSNPHWDYANFSLNFPDRPVPGLISYPLFCVSEDGPPWDFVPFNSDSNWVKLAEFVLVISDNPSLIGTTTPILNGANHIMDGCTFLEYNGYGEFNPVFIGGTIEIVEPGYEYLPGDANMSAGVWPPAVIGSDVTYLMNYFRGTAPGCDLNGFYCSGDANGDCQVIGNDVTALLNYTRGLGPISYCEDYPPAWPTSGDLPPNPPEGWPNCDGMAAAKVIPGEPDRK